MKKQFYLTFILLLFCNGLFGQYNSVLAEGNWHKITTNKAGIYKLSYSSINALEIDVSNLKISDLKLYGNGGGMLPHLNSELRHDDLVENAIKIHDANNNGVFDSDDYMLFYGQSPHVWNFDASTQLFKHSTHLFSEEVNYFLVVNDQTIGKRVQEKHTVQNVTKIITSFNAFSFHESELENLIHSGKEWFGERFDVQNNRSFDFSFPNLISSSPVSIKTAVVARSLVSSVFTIKANGSTIQTINVPNIVTTYATEYAKIASKTTDYNSSSSNINIDITYSSSDNGALPLLNYIEINARRSLTMSGNSLVFRDVTHTGNSINGTYQIENANEYTVWDITDHTNVMKMPTNSSGDLLMFNDSLNELHEYIVFNGSAYLTPVLKESVANQNLHATSSTIEYVIISHPDFLPAANRLADFHQQYGNLQSVVVTPQQIYNEFSSGAQDVSAIRDFLRMLYKRPNAQLKYVLLFGDGSYDPKNRISSNTNYIPTFQSVNSTHPTLSYVTDDYFGLLDDNEGLFTNDLVDIGIGRFPVKTLSEANTLVNKVERYYSNNAYGDWRNIIAFVADDGDGSDGNTHMWQADSLANIIDDKYNNINLEKIYLDNYKQESTPGGPRSPDAQDAITRRIEKGVFLINYTGHGGPLGWTQERILELNQIDAWKNPNKLPLFMTATCKFSYFDNPEETSAGEHVLLNPNGGAIALLSTTRLVYSSPNYNLNTKFINVLFEEENGQMPRLGDVFRKTKVLSGANPNNRNFTLLGDPALCLAYPKYNVVTTYIADTLKALAEVTVEGVITDENNIPLTLFNGTLFPTIFDKEIIALTQGQESCTPMSYRSQKNIIYKGEASIVNGSFSFSFVVPKDIAYYLGKGRISYYALSDNENSDAVGFDEDFLIGGTADDITYDYDGPEIELFMNTRQFISGGITDKNPVLLADISDFSGINTVGNGIGHDIVVVLDGQTNHPLILNDYYKADKDNYKNGELLFPLADLSIGEHTLSLKIWDVFNNSSEATISFVVTDENEFVLTDFINYPNPFSSNTEFYFQHNQMAQNLDVTLEIYSITGSLVRTINNTFFDDGYRIGPIQWNGKDESANRLSAGMYIAQLKIQTENDFTFKSIRLILSPY